MDKKESIIDKALALLGDDMDDLEGKSAMAHSLDECPDPLNCDMHDTESMDSLGADKGEPALTVEIHGEPSVEDKGEKGESLSPEDAEILRKLLK